MIKELEVHIKKDQGYSLPVATRDEQGRLRWVLPGNTLEQNEQIGIRNIQALFLAKCPQFDELFPRHEDGKIPGIQQEQARRFIVTRLGSRQKIKSLAEDSELNPLFLPYFQGCFTVVIAKAFNPWGIDLPEVRDLTLLPRVDRKSGVFIDKNGTSWATTNYFTHRFPITEGTMQRYLEDADFIVGKDKSGREAILYSEPQISNLLKPFVQLPYVDKVTEKYTDENGENWVVARYFAKFFDFAASNAPVYLRRRKIRFITGRAITGKQAVLFNEGEGMEALQTYFALPQVDEETDFYMDPQGINWITGRHITSTFGIDYSTQKRLLKEITTLRGRGRNGVEVTLYIRKDAEEKIERYKALPTVEASGYYIDEKDEAWVFANYFRVKYGFTSAQTQLMKDVPKIRGKTERGVEVDLYNLKQATEKIEHLLSLPQVDKESGKYTDQQGQNWTPVKPFARELQSVSDATLSSVLAAGGVASIIGRDRTGKKVALYHEEEVRKAVRKFIALPQVDKVTGRYTDQDGVQWVVAKHFAKLYGVSENVLPDYLGNTPSIEGRGRTGLFTDLYREDVLAEFVKPILMLPRLDKFTGKYTDGQNQSWVIRKYFTKKFVIDGKTLLKLLGRCTARKGLGLHGREVDLYNESEVEELLKGNGYPLRGGLETNRRGKILINSQDADEELGRLIQ